MYIIRQLLSPSSLSTSWPFQLKDYSTAELQRIGRQWMLWSTCLTFFLCTDQVLNVKSQNYTRHLPKALAFLLSLTWSSIYKTMYTLWMDFLPFHLIIGPSWERWAFQCFPHFLTAKAEVINCPHVGELYNFDLSVTPVLCYRWGWGHLRWLTTRNCSQGEISKRMTKKCSEQTQRLSSFTGQIRTELK